MKQDQLFILAGILMLCCCSSSAGAIVYPTLFPEEDTGPTGPGPGPGPGPINPCAGLTDDSLASSVSVECLRKLLKDEGCNETGTVWPQDDYNGWWRQSPQGTTTVYCDGSGTPCGAGNYATVKSDIHAWATMTDDLHIKGCKGPSST
jgi:hypothetical protein